jgi:hypothetical protein
MTGEAVERFQELSPAQLEHLRRLAQTDLFFMSQTVLGYDQVAETTHGALCHFITDEPANRRMVLMPRGFLKSTICTISDSIRLTVANPEHTRILIANEVFDNAAGFLKEIKAHWDNGSLLAMLFPELLPERRAGPGADWSIDSASVSRSSAYKESTWTVLGVGGTKVSQHFTHIKCDDLAGNRAKESDVEMKKAIRWTEDLVGLLDRPDGPLDFYGTRKTMSDVYAAVMTRFGDQLKVFVREPFEDGRTIFPKISTESLLRIMAETPETWAHDYMNNPIGRGGLDWPTGLLQNFVFDAERSVHFVDSLTGEHKKWKLSELDVIITVDPNSGKKLAPDKAAVIVHGVSPTNEIFVLDIYSGRPSPDQLIDAIWALCTIWHPRCVGLEDAGQQNTMYYFEKKCHKEQRFYRLEHLKHKNVRKEHRIRTALDTPLRSKRLFVLASHITLIGQIQLFPQLAEHNWDEIDALAHGAQLYRTGRKESAAEEEADAESKLLAIRGVTGYGSSYVRRSPLTLHR